MYSFVQRKNTSRFAFYVVVALVGIYLAFPMFWLIVTSFKSFLEINEYPPTFLPRNPTLHAYRVILSGMSPRRAGKFPMMDYMFNSLFVAFASSSIALVAGNFAAYAVVREKLKIGLLLLFGILILRTLPRIAIGMPMYLMIRDFGLHNTRLGLMVVHVTFVFPLVMFLQYSFYHEFPLELEEAARADGTSKFGAFFRVILPLSAPGIAVSYVIAFLFSYGEFLFALILTAPPKAMTLPVALGMFMQEWRVAWDLLSAAATIAMIPAIATGFYLQKYLAGELLKGALKK